MKTYEKILLQNKAWAAEQLKNDPDFFGRLKDLQDPEFLWIGCSDSRVPANQITGTLPGEVFVHRNIANLVVEDDTNVLSVINYAVKYLKVRHIVVCGHYGCGGVKAALGDDSFGMLDKWLLNIKKVRDDNSDELALLKDENARANRLSELNVIQQVKNVVNTSIVQEAWAEGTRPAVHGWIYGLKDGLLKPLTKVMPPVAAEALL